MNQPDSTLPHGPGKRDGEPALRVAFFGGSFDPPHLGHLAVARAARDAFKLDAVLFAPVGAQPLKPEGSAASFAQRLAMTRLAIEGEPGFEVSLADAPKPLGEHDLTPNYTIDAIAGLRAGMTPESVLFCLMGADSFFGLRRWHRAAEIPFAAQLIVASRPGQPSGHMADELKAALPPGLTMQAAPEGDRTESGVEVRAFILKNQAGDRAPFYLLPGLYVEISASEIREGIRESIRSEIDGSPKLGASTRLLPESVARYIDSEHLYL